MPDRRRRLRPPAGLVALSRAFTRGDALTQVATVVTTRHRWRWVDPEGQAVVDVVDDHVSGHRMGADTAAVSWREIAGEPGEPGEPGE